MAEPEPVLPLTDTLPDLRRVALVGNPNVGKTTVFNLLTGRRQKVANYPGVTVERKSGRLIGTETVEVVDLPGTYSLNPKSLDEQIAYDMLVGRIDGETPPDLVVCVVDATNLERNLYLVSQVMDLGLPIIVALNMMDAVRESDLAIDTEALGKALGLPIVPMAALRKEGLDALRRAIFDVPVSAPVQRWTLMPAVAAQVGPLCALLAEHAPDLPEDHRFSEVLHALANEKAMVYWAMRAPAFHAAVLAVRETLEARKVPYRQAEMTGRYTWLGPHRCASDGPAQGLLEPDMVRPSRCGADASDIRSPDIPCRPCDRLSGGLFLGHSGNGPDRGSGGGPGRPCTKYVAQRRLHGPGG